MEPIAKLLQTATATPGASSATPSPTVPRSWGLAFCERMRTLFRESWTAKWSTPADFEQLLADYVAVLAKLTPEQIRTGLDACVGRTFPPNPSEFFGLATTTTQTAPAHRPFKSLPKPPRDPALKEARMADLRAALRRDEYLPRNAS